VRETQCQSPGTLQQHIEFGRRRHLPAPSDHLRERRLGRPSMRSVRSGRTSC
jgi:hypothetical protein